MRNAEAGVFQCRAGGKESIFTECGGDHLEADGKSGAAQAARDGERRETKGVDSAHETGGKETDVFVAAADGDGVLADPGSGGGRGGGSDAIDAAPQLVELGAETASKTLGVNVVDGGDEATLVK